MAIQCDTQDNLSGTIQDSVGAFADHVGRHLSYRNSYQKEAKFLLCRRPVFSYFYSKTDKIGMSKMTPQSPKEQMFAK